MIQIKQVQRDQGEVLLTFEYTDEGETKTVVVDNREIIKRMEKLKQLVGRSLELSDLQDVVVTLINEIREGRRPLLQRFPYEDYIGVDLEG